MLKRARTIIVGLVVLLSVLLGLEIVLALRRTYLPTDPVMKLGGRFGAPDDRPLSFVVLGDSTAAGLGAGDSADAYASVLARRLADTGRRVDLLALGVSGARIHDLLIEQVPQAVQAHPDLVFVGIGANDVTHLTPLYTIEKDTRSMLERLKATGATVVLAGPPDMRARAWLEPLRTLAGWRGRQVADTMAAVARDEGVPVVPLAQQAGAFFAAHPETVYAEDDFHPGPVGYRAWADAIYPVLHAALERSGR